MIYQIKNKVLKHLDSPPSIQHLSQLAAMSPTMLKRLFKQVFGDSVFSYCQGFRMNKAAMMLRDGRNTVSDVGFKMGFTNLSHFSKVFHQHLGIKPKQYSQVYKHKAII